MSSLFKPPLPIIISSGGGGGGGASIVNQTSSVSVNLGSAGDEYIQLTTNNTPALKVDFSQRVIIGNSATINPQSRLSLVDPNGLGLEIFNSNRGLSTSLVSNSQGGLSVITGGNSVDFNSNKIYVGPSSLYINAQCVVATAAELNYTSTTKGVAESSKALIVDDNRDIRNINSLSATSLTGTLLTGHQPNITSLNSVNITELSLHGTRIQSSGSELNYLSGVDVGYARPLKALVVDSNKNIIEINNLGASTISGTLTTATQPNITSLGTLSRLLVNQMIGIGTTTPSKTLDIVSSTPSVRLSNNQYSAELRLDSSGSFVLDLNNDLIMNRGIQFNGTGIISGLSSVSATNLSGTLLTGPQPNITQIGVLEALSVNGDVIVGTTTANTLSQRLTINEGSGKCLKLVRSGTLSCGFIVGNQGDLEIDVTRDVRILNGKALRMTGDVSGVVHLSSQTISGTLLTGPQPNITEIGTLDSLNVVNGVNVSSLSANTLSGTLLTGPQPNITDIGTLNSLSVINGISGSSMNVNTISGTLLTASQPNITTIGTLSQLIVSNNITARSLSSDTLSGTLLTAAQPNITHIGTLSNLNVSQTITTLNMNASVISGTVLTAAQPNITSVGSLSYLNVVNTIGAGSVSATELSGTLLTASQPNITTLGTLTSLSVSGGIVSNSLEVNELRGTLLTTHQPNITQLGTLGRLKLNGSIGIGVDNPSTAIDIDTTNLSIPAAIQLTDGDTNISIETSPTGIVLDTNKEYLTLGDGVGLRFMGGGISNLASISATQITGTLQTPDQPNITHIGTLNYLDTGFIGVGTTHDDFYRMNMVDGNGRLIMLSDGNLTMTISKMDNDLGISCSNKRLALGSMVNLVLNGGTIIGLDQLTTNSISGTIITPNQPNITQLGDLTYLNISGSLNAKDASFRNVSVNNLNVQGNISLSNPMSFTNISSSNANFNAGLPALTSTNGGTLTVIGGASFSRNVIIGESLRIGNITLTEASFGSMQTGTSGIVEPNLSLVANSSKDLLGFRNLSAQSFIGTLTTSYQPNITTVGNLTNLNVEGYLGVGTTSPMKQLEIKSSTGDCLRISNGSSFLDAVIDNTGNATFSGNSSTLTIQPRMVVNKMTLGNSTSTHMPLEIGAVSFLMSGAFAFRTSGGTNGLMREGQNTVAYDYSIRANGRILCTQSLDVMSDRRTKKNIKELSDEYCTSFIERTKPVSFNWKKGDAAKSFGYIAQDLIRAGFDELVNLAHDDEVREEIDDDGFVNPEGVKFTVSYQHIIPILAKNQKRLMQENAELKAKIDAILSMLNSKNQ